MRKRHEVSLRHCTNAGVIARFDQRSNILRAEARRVLDALTELRQPFIAALSTTFVIRLSTSRAVLRFARNFDVRNYANAMGGLRYST